MTKKNDALIKHIEDSKDEIIHFLSELIKIDSQTGNEEQIQEYISNYLEINGIEYDKWTVSEESVSECAGYVPLDYEFKERSNVIGVIKGTGEGRSLILNGHVDTISPGVPEMWKYPPFSGAVTNDRVYGLGASDMKCGLAAFTLAVKFILDLGMKPKGDIYLQYMIDEEVTGYGTLSAIARGYKADAAICCETSDMCIQPACIGRLWFEIEITGKTSSISNIWESESAIEKGILIVQAINELQCKRLSELQHPLYTDNRSALPCAVCMFESGTFPSAIPVQAKLQGSLGIFPHELVEDVKNSVKTEINTAASKDAWLSTHKPVVKFKDLGADGAEIPQNSPIVECLSNAYKETLKRNPVISGRNGGADTRYLIKTSGIPTVIFGPGLTTQMHACNEYVEIKNIVDATKVLAAAILEWCECN